MFINQMNKLKIKTKKRDVEQVLYQTSRVQWNILTDDIKESKNLVIFKKTFKDMTLEKYRRNSIDEAS